MVYLGPSLHSPRGALELNPVWALYARSLTPFFFRKSSALKVDEGDVQAQYIQEEEKSAMKKKRQRYNK